ncbi:YkgJ family cysteine cluster protein [Aliarcobacter butzleri]|uniref:YkgJ family cysteine cluster protein n=1 Tax=Aliarcobacter butzleri TaxID=28197 RepID=UPI001EDBF628|nr:YkgJ family cysteine cluster protein [Aliarcobacter butzleri]MCG3655771.1 YkgJ family cysteine cluster protein [Aliarcobacter butzleri]MCG3696081.1 YkgJ family cysteine cluster protein [Aliarcobacter butzleri]MCG3700272.1 YkgJ family cysteine cluster protein [Aliarcobacter butzleri]MCG3709647.1 YkgJ family cysteine cluster protein [Aliarcobacter butzleri]MDK2050431.1 YkgJ family cysteine cluster protein [Aliarcobacter butzleri]
MKDFIPTLNQNFTFGNCKNCQAHCCSGLHGSIYSQILKEEFEAVYKNFPILFIFGSLKFIKPVILLSNGFDFCPHLKNFKCTIYENRPIVCKTYPLSPNLDNQIYIDSSCPEINKGKEPLKFEESYFKNYQEKYIETHFEFENLKKEDFVKIFTIRNIDFFKYIGDTNSKYLTFHKLSLSNLNKY